MPKVGKKRGKKGKRLTPEPPRYFVCEQHKEGRIIKHCVDIVGPVGFVQVLLVRSLTKVSMNYSEVLWTSPSLPL